MARSSSGAEEGVVGLVMSAVVELLGEGARYRNGEPTYCNSVVPEASPETSQCHIVDACSLMFDDRTLSHAKRV